MKRKRNYLQKQTINKVKQQKNKNLSPVYISPKVLKQSCYGGGGATVPPDR